jgi:hypothetical protein
MPRRRPPRRLSRRRRRGRRAIVSALADLFLAALRDGTATALDDQYMRMAARSETGDPRYRWLTESLFVGEDRLAGDHRIECRVRRVG